MTTEDLNEILKIHGQAAYRMAVQITGGNQVLAEDLVQDAFIKIWKKTEPMPVSVKSWLYRVLRNLYIDHLRRRKREATVSYDVPSFESEVAFVESCPEDEPLILNQLEAAEERGHLHAALARMPEEFRHPVILCDLEGRTYEEIAQFVSCPVGTVRSRIHRGRRLLRAALVQFVVPALTVAITLIGAYFLTKAQRQSAMKIQIPMASIPQIRHPSQHVLLPKEMSHYQKGESRDN